MQAAENEATWDTQKSQQLMMSYVGDTRCLEKLRSLFQEKRYAEVIALADKIQYPELMTESQRRMVEMARRRVSS